MVQDIMHKSKLCTAHYSMSAKLLRLDRNLLLRKHKKWTLVFTVGLAVQ